MLRSILLKMRFCLTGTFILTLEDLLITTSQISEKYWLLVDIQGVQS